MTQYLNFFFYIFSHKINSNILTFYIKSIIFYYYLNKRITSKQKFLLFYIKHFLLFFFSYINQNHSTSKFHSTAKHSLEVGAGAANKINIFFLVFLFLGPRNIIGASFISFLFKDNATIIQCI